MKYIQTSEKVTVENYPYGFRLKTTLYDYIEFDKKKGYRHCTQTVNPKNGALNKPKKSTYYALMVRYYNEENHIKTITFDFNGDKALNKGAKFVAENFDLFTVEEKAYIYALAFNMAKVDMRATVIYGGSKADDLIPLYKDFVEAMVKGFKNPQENYFNVALDTEAIEATKPKDFNPFKVTSYETTT